MMEQQRYAPIAFFYSSCGRTQAAVAWVGVLCSRSEPLGREVCFSCAFRQRPRGIGLEFALGLL